MKEYFYMFTRGQYSDYYVRGLYKSSQQISEAGFVGYFTMKIIDKIPESVGFFLSLEDLTVENMSDTCFKYKLYTYCTGDEKIKYDPNVIMDYNGAYRARKERMDSWFLQKEFNFDLAEMAVKGGILEKLEYEEIWCGS